MRVLHLGKYYPPFAGGIEHFMAALLPALRAQGIPSAALVHDHQPPSRLFPPFQADIQDPDLYRAPCYGRLLYAPISPHFPFWLERSLRAFQPDLLHLHLPNTSAFFALFSPAARRLPWVIHWHSDVLDEKLSRALALAYPFYRPFEQAVLKRSRAVIVTSPSYLAASQALAPWREKCHIIPLALAHTSAPPVSEAARLEAEKLWGNSSLRVLNIGRMTYYKGQQVLLEALRSLPHARAIVVGQGELRPTLQQQLETAGLQQRILLPGYVSDALLNALLASCDCFCLPSLERTEAFGVVLLEAMRHGKPIIASHLHGSGVSWVVQEGKTGILTPVGDASALADALQSLQANPALRLRLGAAGQARLQQQFQMSHVAAQTAALYAKVSSNH